MRGNGMYFQVNERRDAHYGEAVIPVPPILPLIIAALEAAALLAAALAAAWLLVQAYEKARSLGIGAGWALEKATAGAQEVLRRARRLKADLERLYEDDRRQRMPPE